MDEFLGAGGCLSGIHISRSSRRGASRSFSWDGIVHVISMQYFEPWVSYHLLTYPLGICRRCVRAARLAHEGPDELLPLEATLSLTSVFFGWDIFG